MKTLEFGKMQKSDCSRGEVANEEKQEENQLEVGSKTKQIVIKKPLFNKYRNGKTEEFSGDQV